MPKNEKVMEITNPEQAVPTEVLADAIVKISEGMAQILNGRLKKRAVLLLIRDACGSRYSLPTIEDVLNGIESLRKRYVQ